jgi:hypothetical protein
MADRYLLESGSPDGYQLEDGSGVLLLNNGVAWDVGNTHADNSISSDGLTVTHATTDSTDRMARANRAQTSGKWYFEITIGTLTGNATLGIDGGTGPLNDYVGDEANSLGWQQSGNALNHFGVKDTYTTWTSGDTLGVAWDGTKAYFSKIISGAHNWQGTSTDPVAGTGGLTPDTAITNAYPAIDLVKVGDDATANFGETTFAGPIPSGYTSWDGSQTSSGGGVTGTIAATEAADTASASGSSTITGTGAITEASDTASASGTSTVTGTIARTEANDSAAASGAVTVSGTLARTEASDTAAASGAATVSGTAAITEATDSAAASGSSTVTGTLTRTEANDNAALSGSSTITGTAALTEANDNAAASGTVSGGPITGTAAITEASDTAAASGAATITGTLTRSESNDTAAATGAVGGITGTAALSEASDTAHAVGLVIALGKVKLQIAGTWTAKPAKVWNGTSWVTKPAKWNDGSSWKATNF